MTDRIDLDELDDGEGDDATDGGSTNRGDWFWREEGTPDDGELPEQGDARTGDGEDGPASDGDARDTGGSGDTDGPSIPRVPREHEGKPAGIPVEGGGSGPGAVRGTDAAPEPPTESPGGDAEAGHGTSGPHGGGVDDMTMALTYEACTRLADPAAAVADARSWSDWIGIVGDVAAHVINKFQRDHTVDADFFNGTGTGPGERLAGIDEHSMFYAERMVVVGVPGEEWIAEAAGWEFVPLSDAAAKAGWDME